MPGVTAGSEIKVRTQVGPRVRPGVACSSASMCPSPRSGLRLLEAVRGLGGCRGLLNNHSCVCLRAADRGGGGLEGLGPSVRGQGWGPQGTFSFSCEGRKGWRLALTKEKLCAFPPSLPSPTLPQEHGLWGALKRVRLWLQAELPDSCCGMCCGAWSVAP